MCACVFLRFGYVCASKTMALRRLLEAANSDTGFTNQEKGVCVCEGKSICVWNPVLTCYEQCLCVIALRNVVILLLFCLLDPEEFLNKLFQLLRVEPLLKIR